MIHVVVFDGLVVQIDGIEALPILLISFEKMIVIWDVWLIMESWELHGAYLSDVIM